MWGVFPGGLGPQQVGEMTFSNTFGSYALTGNFTEWIPGPPGYSPHAVLRKPVGAPLGKQPAPPVEIGDQTPAQIEAGDWDFEVHVFDKGPDQPPEIVHGAESNRLVPTVIGDDWFVERYEAIFQGLPFEQNGVIGWDPNKAKWVGTYVKTVQSNLGLFEGDYDKATRTLTLVGETRSCFGEKGPDGKILPAREKRVTKYIDMNTKQMSVHQQMPDKKGQFTGDYIKRDETFATRRKPVEGVNIPCVGSALMTLISLQRARHEVKVVGKNSSNSHVYAAAGMVMLGPAWNAIFGEAVRL